MSVTRGELTGNSDEVRRLHIGYLCQWWSESTYESVPGNIANAIKRLGHDVAVVAGPPLDLRSGIIDGQQPWWRFKSEATGGFPTRRCPSYPGHSQSTLRRIAMYSSFAVAASFGALRLLGSSDLNVVYASPATAAAPALVAKLRHGVPYVLVVQDVWPDSVFAAGFLTEGPIHRTAHDWLSTFVNSVYRHASHIVVISEGMRRLLISRGVPAERLTVIYNWASEQDGLSPLTFPNRSKVEPLHLMYAGNVGAPQGLDNVIRALARVPREKFHFTIVGGGSGLQSLRELVRREGLSNVDFKEPVSPSALRQLQAGAHVHLVSLIDDPLFRVTIPSKLQELMNSGVAILAVAPGEVADLVSQAAAGLAVTPGDDSTLADALMDLSDRPNEWFSACGLSGRRFYQARMGSAVGRQGYQEAIRKSIMDHVD